MKVLSAPASWGFRSGTLSKTYQLFGNEYMLYLQKMNAVVECLVNQ